MTRSEFDHTFAATEDNTEGFSLDQLAAINDAVFKMAVELDISDDGTKSLVDAYFEREFNKY